MEVVREDVADYRDDLISNDKIMITCNMCENFKIEDEFQIMITCNICENFKLEDEF